MSQTLNESFDGTIDEYELILYVFTIIKLFDYLKSIKAWDSGVSVPIRLIAHEIQPSYLARGVMKIVKMEELEKS